MSLDCGTPDTSIGVALRLSRYLDCHGRALGENGFQAMVGGPVAAGLLLAVVTLFVAVVGYRLLTGKRIAAGDGIGWALRLGVVLTLVTGWPAFQTLVYRVATDGPQELAAVLIPATGIPADGLDERVQLAYDTIRLGGGAPTTTDQTDNSGTDDRGNSGASPSSGPTARPTGLGAGQVPRPYSALLLVVSTIGLTSALRLTVGFLLAVGPLPILCALFDRSIGIFAGWAATLAGSALAITGTSVVTALDLVMVEGEIANIQAYSRGMIAAVVDPEALTVIIVFFTLVALVAALLALRTTATLRIYLRSTTARLTDAALPVSAGMPWTASRERQTSRTPAASSANDGGAPSRAAAMTGALERTIRREQLIADRSGVGRSHGQQRDRGSDARQVFQGTGYGASGRRMTARQTRSATARDEKR